MKRAVLPFLALALGATLSGANRAPAATRSTARHSTTAAGTIGRMLDSAVGPERDARDDRAALRRRVKAEEAGTYIGDILAERDSSLARWPDRSEEPLTVWIQPASGVADFGSSYASRVREAFEDWDLLRLPVHFAFVADSAQAEVHVTWIDRFVEPISGRTRWTRDDDWTITDANITLALHHSNGELLDHDAMHAMALHEIGHLIGLDHTTDTLSVMAPRVRVRALSSADRATARLIYSMPAGPLR